EKIEAYESTLSSSQSQEISTSDSLAHALGIKEHCERVRGLGLGPCPSKIFGVQLLFLMYISSLTAQVDEMKTVISLLLQNYPGQLPSQLDATFQPSVSDQGSVPNDGCNEKEEP
ncbi:hypothetical protein V8G54_023446, partial [Vigna mungo]